MRGRVSFTAGGKEHGLQFTTNRLCSLEEQSGRSTVDFAVALSGPDGAPLRDVRLLLQVGLGGAMTLAEVGDIIDEIGFKTAIEIAVKALHKAFDLPAPEETGAGKTIAVAA